MSKAEAIIECIRSAVNLSRLADDDDACIEQWQRAKERYEKSEQKLEQAFAPESEG